MSAVNSTTYAIQIADKMAQDSGVIYAGLHVINATYEAATLAADDTINVCKLPDDAVVHEIIVDYDDLGTGGTLDVGDVLDVDRYIDGADTSSAGVARINEIAGRGYRIGTTATDNIITATNLGAESTGTIKFTVFYAM